MPKDIYQFDGKQLTIIDEALKLSYIHPFAPIRIPDNFRKGKSKLPKGFCLAFEGESLANASSVHIEKNDVREGQMLLFYPSSKLKMENFYKDGDLHGPSTYYSEQGEILYKGWFIDGVQQGKCWKYYFQGALYCIETYLDGCLHGSQQYYYPDGTLKTKLCYSHGKLKGNAILYNPSGTIERKIKC